MSTNDKMSTTGPLAAHAAPYLKLTLPAKFYNVPADAPAMFSTRNGTRAKRQLFSPSPAPIVRSDFDGEVKRMAALLRKELPQVAGLIRNPGAWKDLYYFFDAVDLWVEGAVFLYYVISHISKDNELAHESYIRMHQNAMIFHYAANWVTNNADRIAPLPTETDFTTLFNQFQKGDMSGFRDYEVETMKQALRFHHARLREKYNAVAQAHRVDPVQQPASHPPHGVQQGFVPAMQHAPPMDSQSAPVLDHKDQYHHKIVPVHPVAHPTPQTYSHFMEAQRTIPGAVTSPPAARGPFYKGNGDLQRGPRARGYSGDAGRNGPFLPKGHLPHGNENHIGFHDQRAVDSASRRTPPRQVPHANQPIYVHNPQRMSSPHGRDTVMNTRTFSDSQAGRAGGSNNARLWNDSSKPPRRQSQSSPGSFEKSGSSPQSTGHYRSQSIAFVGHPNAKVTDKSSTFYYIKDNMDQKTDYCNNRTVYVHGASVEMFLSHALKEMMSEVGTVESISFLYPNRNMGPAFVTFTEESVVQPAISRFHGIILANGRQLEVKIPDKGRTSRDRSGSQSSQYYQGQNSNYQVRHNPRNFRKNSISNRAYNRAYNHPYRDGNAVESQDGSPNAHRYQSADRSPLTTGFQAQLEVSPPFAVPVSVENLHSSISEILQHQSAMERLRLAQMPLEPIDNYSGGNRKSNGPQHEKSRWNKENSPVKNSSKDTTPVITPTKEQIPASDATAVKSNTIIDLVEVLRASARQKSPVVPLNSSDSKDGSKFCANDSITEPKQVYFQDVKTLELATEPVLHDAIINLEMHTEVDTSAMTSGNCEHCPQSEDAPKSRKLKKNKSKQGNLRRGVSNSSDATATTSTQSVDTASPTPTDTTDYKSATTSFSEESSRDHSFISAKSTVSLSTTNDNSMEPDVQSTPTAPNKSSKAGSSSSSSSFTTPKPPSSRHQYRSRDFKNKMKPSEFYSNTHCVANTKSDVADDKKSDDQIPKPVLENISPFDGATNIDDPATSLRDPNQWPALEHTKIASSRIADGKPPVVASIPPLTGSNTSTSAKNSIAIVPALPLNMIPRRSNSEDTAASEAWPRVRRFVGK